MSNLKAKFNFTIFCVGSKKYSFYWAYWGWRRKKL